MIRLRPYKQSDASYVVKWITDEKELVQWCNDRFIYPLTEGQMSIYYLNSMKNSDAMMMTALDGQGIPIGIIVLEHINYQKGSAELCCALIEKKGRGNGKGSTMLSMAIQFAFILLKLNKLQAHLYDQDKQAYYCFHKVGFCDDFYNLECFTYREEKWGRFEMSIINTSESCILRHK